MLGLLLEKMLPELDSDGTVVDADEIMVVFKWALDSAVNENDRNASSVESLKYLAVNVVVREVAVLYGRYVD